MVEVANYGPFPRQFPGLNDSDQMLAMQGSRVSQGHMVPASHPPDVHTSVIKKTYESVLAKSSSASPSDLGVFQRGVRMDEDEEVEEDFSDHDSHYSEDFEDYMDDSVEEAEEESPNVTKQLLGFADMINTDIQKFFGRRKGDEDSCDIYEDKWVTMKSGRELYYADLVKIAHGEDKGRKHSKSPVLLDISVSDKDRLDNVRQFSGKLDKKLGMGPLNELFEYGLRHFLSESKFRSREFKRMKVDPKRFDSVVPMQNRKLPRSFWQEPGASSQQGDSRDPKNSTGQPSQQSNTPPDFSDLLESWRLERSGFNGDVSSGEVSLSPESVIEHV